MENQAFAPATPFASTSDGAVAHLSAHLHFAVVDEDVIVLDECTDAYSCLPGAGAVIQVRGDRIVAPEPVLEQLRDGGFLGPAGESRAVAPPAPTRALSLRVWIERKSGE